MLNNTLTQFLSRSLLFTMWWSTFKLLVRAAKYEVKTYTLYFGKLLVRRKAAVCKLWRKGLLVWDESHTPCFSQFFGTSTLLPLSVAHFWTQLVNGQKFCPVQNHVTVFLKLLNQSCLMSNFYDSRDGNKCSYYMPWVAVSQPWDSLGFFLLQGTFTWSYDDFNKSRCTACRFKWIAA